MISSLQPNTVEAKMKPESISSGYDPVKSEETDDEDCKDIDNTSNSYENINIKEEAVKVEVKTEDDASTDDERSPEFVSSGYNPAVKSEETDDEDTDDEDTKTSNEHHLPIKVKSEAKTEDESTDDEYGSETKEPVKQAVSTQESNIQHTSKKKRRHSGKRKRELEKSNNSNDESVKKIARIECSVEGCTGKAAGNGRCRRKHNGYDLCSHDGCTNQVKSRGVCARHGAKVKTCSHNGCTNQVKSRGVCVKHGAIIKTCSHEGCTNKARGRVGVCARHGAKRMKTTCKHEGCTNQVVCRGMCDRHGKTKKTCNHVGCTNNVINSGVCIRHGAVVKKKTCSFDGCTKHVQKGGFCTPHYRLSNSKVSPRE